MDERFQNLTNLTEEKFRLNNYHLKRYGLDRHVNIYGETKYNLILEWFPNEVTHSEADELMPEGAAVITLDIESGNVNQVIFVKDKSYVKDYLFGMSNKKDIINWIETESGFVYEKDFILSEESKGKYAFTACVDGVKTFPKGSIDLEYDELGRLTFYSVNGQFPRDTYVEKSETVLSLEEVEHITEERLKLIDIPSEQKERQIPVYHLESVFIKKDGLLTIPIEIIESVKEHYQINQLIYWEKPSDVKFKRVDLELAEDISLEQVSSKEKSPDAFPITALQKTECINAVKDFLRQVYPTESGKWILTTLYREFGYIHAELKKKDATNNVFEHKIIVMINQKNLQVVNYLDNEPLLDLMSEYTDRNEVIISHKLAYERLIQHIRLEPYYVFDFAKNKYIYCHKLVCDYVVNANNGRVTRLNEVK